MQSQNRNIKRSIIAKTNGTQIIIKSTCPNRPWSSRTNGWIVLFPSIYSVVCLLYLATKKQWTVCWSTNENPSIIFEVAKMSPSLCHRTMKLTSCIPHTFITLFFLFYIFYLMKKYLNWKPWKMWFPNIFLVQLCTYRTLVSPKFLEVCDI